MINRAIEILRAERVRIERQMQKYEKQLSELNRAILITQYDSEPVNLTPPSYDDNEDVIVLDPLPWENEPLSLT